MRHFCYFRGFFFGKDLPLFLTKKISKKQNCGLPKFLLISFKNELLLKKFSDSKSMTLLDIKTYHYDIFVTNTIDIMKALRTYKISLFFFFSKYHFPWCNLSFSTVLTQHDSGILSLQTF